jgi:hypothetical protein
VEVTFVVECKFRNFDDDSVLEIRMLGVVPDVGEVIVIEGVTYQTTTPPLDVNADATTVYVKKVSES